MRFHETGLDGAYIIEATPHVDHRGFFGRIWCRDELVAQGLVGEIAQSNVGYSARKGTLRGLHLQTAPHSEVKIIRCTRGAVFDVIVDLRPESPTYCKWFGTELNDSNLKMMYVPEGFATGYVTLRDDVEIYYHTSQAYDPASATGVRYNDPAFGIEWPAEITIISDQDRGWPDLGAPELTIQGSTTR